MAWGPSFILFPLLFSTKGLKCPKMFRLVSGFRNSVSYFGLILRLWAPLYQSSAMPLSRWWHCNACFHKILLVSQKSCTIIKGDVKDNQILCMLTSGAYDSCSQAPYTSITFHFFTETNPFSVGCLLIFHMHLITLIKQMAQERHLQQNKI